MPQVNLKLITLIAAKKQLSETLRFMSKDEKMVYVFSTMEEDNCNFKIITSVLCYHQIQVTLGIYTASALGALWFQRRRLNQFCKTFGLLQIISPVETVHNLIHHIKVSDS